MNKSNAATPSRTKGAIAMTRQHDHRFRGGFEGTGSGVSEVLMPTVYHDGGGLAM